MSPHRQLIFVCCSLKVFTDSPLQRRAIALSAAAGPRLQAQRLLAGSRSLPAAVSQFRSYTSSRPLRQHAFQSQLDSVPNAFDFLSSPKPAGPVNPQTLTEKIVQQHSVGLAPGKKVRSGDYVTIKPHHCMTHDNTWPVALKFMSSGATKIHDNRQVVFTLDHDVGNKSESNLKKYSLIEDFARQHGVDFYPAGRGIGHQIMVEEGYAWPGTLTSASRSILIS